MIGTIIGIMLLFVLLTWSCVLCAIVFQMLYDEYIYNDRYIWLFHGLFHFHVPEYHGEHEEQTVCRHCGEKIKKNKNGGWTIHHENTTKR